MKFAFSSVILLASISAVLSQNTSTSASATSSTSMGDNDSNSSSSTGSSAASAPTATCSLVSGDPTVQPFGCVEGATTVTPPYNSDSLASFQIGKYKPAKSAEPISSVATDMAKTVTSLYPTLTVSFSDIVHEYVSALSLSATMYQENHDAAVGTYQLPAALPMMAMAVVAVAAGGAFIL